MYSLLPPQEEMYLNLYLIVIIVVDVELEAAGVAGSTTVVEVEEAVRTFFFTSISSRIAHHSFSLPQPEFI